MKNTSSAHRYMFVLTVLFISEHTFKNLPTDLSHPTVNKRPHDLPGQMHPLNVHLTFAVLNFSFLPPARQEHGC